MRIITIIFLLSLSWAAHARKVSATVSGPSNSLAHWIRVGDEISVWASISGSPPGNGTDASVLVSLPTGPSIFGAVTACAGVISFSGRGATTPPGSNGYVEADTGSGLVKIHIDASNTGDFYYSFTYTYVAP